MNLARVVYLQHIAARVVSVAQVISCSLQFSSDFSRIRYKHNSLGGRHFFRDHFDGSPSHKARRRHGQMGDKYVPFLLTFRYRINRIE